MRIAVRVVDAKGRVLRPVEVVVELANAAAGVEPLVRKLEPAADGGGGYEYRGRDFVVAGRWSVVGAVGSTDVKAMVSGPDVFFDQSGWSARRPPRRREPGPS